MKETYLALAIDTDDLLFLEESDSFRELKEEYVGEPDTLIAKVIWKSEASHEPIVYPVPEGECLDGLLSIQED